MAKKAKWVVRVIIHPEEVSPRDEMLHHGFGEFLEQLRYAGLIHVHETVGQTHQTVDKYLFDIRAPNGISDTKVWSEMNAERMKSFGYNAVSAPEWKS